MYAQYFGLQQLPFNNTPDPRFFFPTPDHEEALATLIYAVSEAKGFVLLTGEVGSGKTLVSRMMLRHFGERISFATVNHSSLSARDLISLITMEFKLDVDPNSRPAQLIRALQDHLLAMFAENTPAVLLLDEAQNLPRDAFELLRTIGNLEANDAKLLQIIILGQPELRRQFNTPDMRQLRQRLFRTFHLPALDREQCEKYIRHRLNVAGGEGSDLFEPSAFGVIYRASQGLPRLINTLCDNAMLSAYSAERTTIDGAFMESVLAQMTPTDGPTLLPAPPTQSRTLAEPAIQGPTGKTSTMAPSATTPTGRPRPPVLTAPSSPVQPVSSQADALAVGRTEKRLAVLEQAAADTRRRNHLHAEQVDKCLERIERIEAAIQRVLHTGHRQAENTEQLSAVAEAARRTAEKSLEQITGQFTRTERMALTAHGMLTGLRERLENVERQLGAHTAVASTTSRAAPALDDSAAPATVSPRLARLLDNSHSTLGQFRTLLESHRSGHTVGGPSPGSHIQESNRDATPSSEGPTATLAQRIGNLADFVQNLS